jgi:hypothetical protein
MTHLLKKPIVHYPGYKGQPVVPALSQECSLNSSIFCLFNIILMFFSIYASISQVACSYRFPTSILCYFASIPCKLYAPAF